MKLVVDANVMVSAILGRSIGLLEHIALDGTDMVTPLRMMIETQKVLRRETGLAESVVLAKVATLAELVTPLDPNFYEPLEARARERLEPAGQPDWPVLATALALDAPIWSNDKHFRGVGVAVWSILNMRFFEGASM